MQVNQIRPAHAHLSMPRASSSLFEELRPSINYSKRKSVGNLSEPGIVVV